MRPIPARKTTSSRVRKIELGDDGSPIRKRFSTAPFLSSSQRFAWNEKTPASEGRWAFKVSLQHDIASWKLFGNLAIPFPA
jgi:hypothetical protein